MQRLESHIENLLLSHECVIIPGLGGFVTRYEEPFFSEDKKEIFPPYRSVSFNSQLRENDGLLTQSYMAAYDTSYPKALSLMDKDVRALIEKIDTEGKCHIGTIGTLQYAQNNALLFTPDSEAGFYSKELYGLNLCLLVQTTSAHINSENNTPADNKTEEKATVTVIASETTEDTNNTNTVIAKDPSHYIIRISKSAVRNTVATVAAAMLYFIFAIAPSSSPLVSPNVREAAVISTSTSKTPKAQIKLDNSANTSRKQVNTPATSTKAEGSKTDLQSSSQELNQAKQEGGSTSKEAVAPKTNNTIIGQQPAPTKLAVEAEKHVVKAPKSSAAASNTSAEKQEVSSIKSHTYTLVLASEVTLKGATNMVEEMHKAGFNAARVMQDGKMIRVVYSSYSDNHSAYTALRALSTANKYFQSAWVMKQ